MFDYSARNPSADSLRNLCRKAGVGDELFSILGRIASDRDEVYDHGGTRTAVVAWWTDAAGRKWVRVSAGSRDAATGVNYVRADSRDDRPPYWYVCPPRCFRVTRPRCTPAWLGACACGETGTPDNVLWAGDRCGGCHDRREEGFTISEPPLVRFTVPGRVAALGFARDGLPVAAREERVLTASAGQEKMRLIPRRLAGANAGDITSLEVSPDGRRAVAACRDEATHNTFVYDLEARTAEVLSCAALERGRILRFAFSADGRELHVRAGDRPAGVFAFHDSRAGGRFFHRHLTVPWAFSPDGNRRAVVLPWRDLLGL